MDKVPLRVLLVEDDPDDYLLTSELLQEIPGSKITIDWAKDFDAGRAALRKCEHDAVLLDYRLGKETGMHLLREALGQGCKAPVILLTGQGDRDLALEALEAGAADYLVKGDINAVVLERSIRYALQQKRHALELEEKVRERTAELEEANRALRESEKRIRALLDTTESARVSAEAAKSRAEAATRAKDDFLAALSHELRTPLNPALLLATSLAEDPSVPAAVREDIEVIARGIALQAQLVDDLLDLTRITGGKLRLDLLPIDAHASMRHVHDILRADIQEREIKLTLELGAAHHVIKADAVRVQQIFWNVLKNAVKFTPPGGSVTVRSSNPAGGSGDPGDGGGGHAGSGLNRRCSGASSMPSFRKNMSWGIVSAAWGSGLRSRIAWWACRAGGFRRKARAAGAAPPSGSNCRWPRPRSNRPPRFRPAESRMRRWTRAAFCWWKITRKREARFRNCSSAVDISWPASGPPMARACWPRRRAMIWSFPILGCRMAMGTN